MKRCALVVLVLAGLGCQMFKPVYLNREARTVAVLPPFNGSNYLEASAKAWPHVEHEVARRGYSVVPRSTVEAFYAKNKFHLPEEIRQYSADELARELKCDLILYSNVAKWDRVTAVIYTKLVVAMEGELRDAKEGTVLWRGEGEAGDSSSALSLRDAAGDTLAAVLSNCEQYVGPACSECFDTLPLAGFEPKE